MNRTYLYSLLALLLACQLGRAQGIKIMSGTTFKLTGGTYNLVLAGNVHLENNAPITGDNLIIKGTGNSGSIIRGTGTLNIAELQVNKAAGQTMLLQKNIGVAEGVFFTSGLLDLNGFDVILADTAALVNESATSRITGIAGAVQITQNLNAPLAENPGNLGLVITSGADWGATQIRRSPATFTNGIGGSSIQRSFQVTPANNTGLNAFLRMYYFDTELNALSESNLDFFQSGNGGANWTNIGSAGRNTTLNFVNVNGVQTMSLLTLSTTNNPLPMQLREFYVSCVHNRPRLQWRIDNPAMVAFFRVDKSRDGAVWENVADKIELQSSPEYIYSYSDVTTAYPYYRLESVGPDGAVSYSPVQVVNCEESGYDFRLLQNPVQNVLPLSVQAKASLDMTITVLDLEGRTIQQRFENIPAGLTRLSLDISGMAKGMYLVQISHEQETLWQTKFVK